MLSKRNNKRENHRVPFGFSSINFLKPFSPKPLSFSEGRLSFRFTAINNTQLRILYISTFWFLLIFILLKLMLSIVTKAVQAQHLHGDNQAKIIHNLSFACDTFVLWFKIYQKIILSYKNL